MSYYDEYDEPEGFEGEDDRPPDRVEEEAVDAIRTFFETHRERVFSSRQIEVEFENRYFHWISHRVLKLLRDEGTIRLEQRTLAGGAPINFAWHRTNRYTRRQIADVQALVERYSHPDFTAALGQTGELLVGDGFSRFQFVQHRRNAREYNGRKWTQTEHNLDFIFERDGFAYGVEVKNTLPYINDKELGIKLNLCDHLQIAPVFVTRAMPAIWIQDIAKRGGFTLVLRYHLYPLSHKAFATEVRTTLGLPVDAPKALMDGTMQRFVTWHDRRVAARGTGGGAAGAAGAPSGGARRRSARGPIRPGGTGEL